MSVPVDAVSAAMTAHASAATPGAPVQAAARSSFSDLLAGGVDKVNRQVLEAQSQAAAFALDDSIPVHQVTYALEQARLSMELMLQVRAKLVDGFQDLLRMQL